MTRLALAGLIVAVAGGATALLAHPVAALQQVDVSRAPGSQAQVAIAADTTGSVLLAAANSLDPRTPDRGIKVDVYTSVDGGSTWHTFSPDETSRQRCSTADPAPAIGADGLELVAFVVRRCSVPFDVASFGIDVVARHGADARWSRAVVAPVSPTYGNDKPAAAIDSWPGSPHRGRAYVAWSRWHGVDVPIRIALSTSDDDGRTWTSARPIAGLPDVVSGFASLSIGPGGAVYLAWTDDHRRVFVARSGNGGGSFAGPALVASPAGPPSALCGYSGVAVRAQPRRCITTDPSVVVGAGRVYVTWTGPGRGGIDQDVFVRSFSRLLRPLTRPVHVSVSEAARRGDQFLAASSFDRAGDRLWVCFYDTAADPRRVRARYSCTASRDGVAWSPALPVASVPSDETADDALDAGYGDYEGVVTVRGVAHPIWTDGRDLKSHGEEIFTTRLTADRLGRRQGQ